MSLVPAHAARRRQLKGKRVGRTRMEGPGVDRLGCQLRPARVTVATHSEGVDLDQQLSVVGLGTSDGEVSGYRLPRCEGRVRGIQLNLHRVRTGDGLRDQHVASLVDAGGIESPPFWVCVGQRLAAAGYSAWICWSIGAAGSSG